MAVTLIRVDAASLTRTLKNAETKATRNLERSVNRAALLIETAIKGKASGRPGPRAPTGNYRRSINTRKVRGTSGRAVAFSVGTTAVQGRRLEFGFMNMTDALGRTFQQPPYPHFGPGFEEARPKALELIRREVNPFA